MTASKIETVIFSNNMGEGLILKPGENIEFRKETPLVAGEYLIPGTFTSMSGYFRHSLEFCGVINKNGLVFHIGDDTNLFDTKKYYQVVHLISETRVFSMFTFQSGRDFNYVNGRWK